MFSGFQGAACAGWPALLAAVLLSGCGCDGIEATETSKFRAEPAVFQFSGAAIGAAEETEVQIFNDGAGPLVLTDIRLDDTSSGGEFELFLNQEGTLVEPPKGLEIPGGSDDPVLFVVRYTASDEVPDRGSVRILTNDPNAGDNGDVTIPVVTGSAGGEILIDPRTVDFGQIEAGSEGCETVRITNTGLNDLTVSRLTINGSEDFSIRGQETPFVIASNETVELTVCYAPEVLGADGGELVIESSDPVEPSAVVTLRANGAAPCIAVVPDDVNFGSSLIIEDRDAPTPNIRGFSIESCGTTALRVTRIEIESPDGAFEMVDLPEVAEGEPLFEIPAAVPDEDFPSAEAFVGFWPEEMRAYGGTARIFSNAQAEPLEVSLFGRGVQNACPIPVSRTERYDVPPLEIVTLDGSPSMDPGGEVQRWVWTVVSRPDGSTSEPVEMFTDPTRPADGGDEDDDSTPTANFFVDLAGDFEIELQVFDNLGQVSCDPVASARVLIHAVPDEDLHVQLVWTTPDDPDETDGTGTDVDLHLRHERASGMWGHDPFDCYFRNSTPDWGVQGDPADNPSLDIDDTNGAGPENINLSDPEVGVTYDVGAIYFRSESTFGLRDVDPRTEHLSLVTVRIFARGDLLTEVVDREMEHVDEIWHVARITWCEDFQRCPEIEVLE